MITVDLVLMCEWWCGDGGGRFQIIYLTDFVSHSRSLFRFSGSRTSIGWYPSWHTPLMWRRLNNRNPAKVSSKIYRSSTLDQSSQFKPFVKLDVIRSLVVLCMFSAIVLVLFLSEDWFFHSFFLLFVYGIFLRWNHPLFLLVCKYVQIYPDIYTIADAGCAALPFGASMMMVNENSSYLLGFATNIMMLSK